MRVSAVQMDVKEGDVRGNLGRAYKGIQVASQRGSQLVLLPEMWTTGFAYPELRSLAKAAFGPSMEFVRDSARESKAWVVGSLPEVDGDSVFNTLFYVRPNGEVAATYRKVHLFPPMRETEFFKAGNKVVLTDSEWGKLGGVICFDIRFPEITRRVVLEGAKVVLVPAQFPNPRRDHWQALLQARAIENQVFIVACNRVGETKSLSFFGSSTIFDPWGRQIEALDDKPGVMTADLDLRTVDAVRDTLAVWPARRPDVYGDCTPS